MEEKNKYAEQTDIQTSIYNRSHKNRQAYSANR